jgi:hypothetical protein
MNHPQRRRARCAPAWRDTRLWSAAWREAAGAARHRPANEAAFDAVGALEADGLEGGRVNAHFTRVK